MARNYTVKNLLLFCAAFLFLSCGASRKVVVRKENKSASTQSVPAEKVPEKLKVKIKNPKNKLSTEERANLYIETYAEIAVSEMKRHEIPASITLAQGILESGMGTGRLAVEGNNHFGIKCHKDWKGKKIYHDDDEKGECFRVYSDPAKSYRDHSLFLSERSRYAFLFKIKKGDYKAWAKGLKKAGYATDPKYPDKLISLIERFDLDKFDNKRKIKKKSEVPFLVEKIENKSVKTHQVIKGDTLYSISKKYNIDLETLVQKNQIIDNTIFLGQDLIIHTNE